MVGNLRVKGRARLACWSFFLLQSLFLFFFEASHHIGHWETVGVALFSFGVKFLAYLFVGPLDSSINNGNNFRDIGDVVRLAVRVEEFVLWLYFNFIAIVYLGLELFHFAELNALLAQHIVEDKFELFQIRKVFILCPLLPLWFMSCAYFQKSFHLIFRLSHMSFDGILIFFQLPIVDFKCSFTCFFDCHENFDVSQLPEVLWVIADPPLL